MSRRDIPTPTPAPIVGAGVDYAQESDEAAELTDEAAAEFRIIVNGLEMGTDTWARVMAAIRGLNPEVASLSDLGAVQAVMASVMATWVATWEARLASPPLQQVIDEATRTALAAQQAAFDKAMSDLGQDVQRTVVT